MDALIDLREQSNLSAKSGFTEDFASEAEERENVILIRFEDMQPS
jgi:hypothetical protein